MHPESNKEKIMDKQDRNAKHPDTAVPRAPYSPPCLNVVELRPEEQLLACGKSDIDNCNFIGWVS